MDSFDFSEGEITLLSLLSNALLLLSSMRALPLDGLTELLKLLEDTDDDALDELRSLLLVGFKSLFCVDMLVQSVPIIFI